MMALSVTVDVDGVSHSGRYEVSRNMVTAYYNEVWKTTHVGASAESTARMLVREMAQEAG